MYGFGSKSPRSSRLRSSSPRMEYQYRSRAGSPVDDLLPVDIIVHLEINIDSLDEFKVAIATLRQQTKLREGNGWGASGCTNFEVLQGDAENKFVLVEQYANQTAAATHAQSQHLKDWGKFLYGKNERGEPNLVQKTVARSKVSLPRP